MEKKNNKEKKKTETRNKEKNDILKGKCVQSQFSEIFVYE